MSDILKVDGIVCAQCYTLLFIPYDVCQVPPDDRRTRDCSPLPPIEDRPAHQTCKCNQTAIIKDVDNHLHVYCDTPSALIAEVFVTQDHKVIDHTILSAMDQHPHAEYSPVLNSELYYKQYAPKNDYVRTTSTSYDTNLIAALDRYQHHTSDGKEIYEHLATRKQRPKKR